MKSNKLLSIEYWKIDGADHHKRNVRRTKVAPSGQATKTCYIREVTLLPADSNSGALWKIPKMPFTWRSLGDEMWRHRCCARRLLASKSRRHQQMVAREYFSVISRCGFADVIEAHLHIDVTRENCVFICLLLWAPFLSLQLRYLLTPLALDSRSPKQKNAT